MQSTPTDSPIPLPTPREQLRQRLQAALAAAYSNLEAANSLPALARPILGALRPRLERSLDEQPERAAAILTWAWARIPQLVGDAVDLTDAGRVAAIVERVEEVEGWTTRS